MYKSFFKSFFDWIGALLLLILSSPLFIIILFIQLFVTKGKIFFFQQRPGLHADPFILIKFRNMNEKKDENGILLPEQDRITTLGKFLRKTNLDELPQLINILKGEMSIIGPRPLLMEYLNLYNESQSKRHLVKPGLTGWAQINGGNDLPWKKKFEYDIEYVERLSFCFDLKIIAITIWKVIALKGFNTGKIIIGKFKGNIN